MNASTESAAVVRTTTIMIGSINGATCCACGGRTAVHLVAHTKWGHYDGCGATFTHVTHEFSDPEQIEFAKTLRPDLVWFDNPAAVTAAEAKAKREAAEYEAAVHIAYSIASRIGLTTWKVEHVPAIDALEKFALAHGRAASDLLDLLAAPVESTTETTEEI